MQFLTGFLLTLPFQARFATLSRSQSVLYLTTLGLAVAAAGFLIAPVSLHRVLFRRRARPVTVAVGDRLARVGLVLLGASIVGVCCLVFDVVEGSVAGAVAGTISLLLLTALWLLLPLRLRDRLEQPGPKR